MSASPFDNTFSGRLRRAIEANSITRSSAIGAIKACHLGAKQEMVIERVEEWVRAYARRRVLEEVGKDLPKELDDA